MFFDQTFGWNDLAVVGLLIVLEGVLSIDNALVLGLLAKRLPKHLQARALTYGLVGAFVFRLIAIATAAYLLKWRVVKLLGGGYLVYVAVRHLFFEAKEHVHEKIALGPDGQPILCDEHGQPVECEANAPEIRSRSHVPVPKKALAPVAGDTTGHSYKFWSTVGVIELTDIAFAVDSILAAIALVGAAPKGHTGFHPKLWVVITGGMLGVILMRFAAVVFIKLLEKFPRFETAAYLLVIVIGGKLLADWGFNSAEHPHRVDFHDYHSPAFWVFWIVMLLCFLVGFLPQKKKAHGA
jgi:YkoY family integral membrane protein